MEDRGQSFEAALAPHVDRLFVAGHMAARPYASQVRRDLDIPHFGVLIDLRKLLLSPGGVDVEEGHALERYASRESVESALRAHVDQGLLREEDARFLPTERGRDALMRLTDALVQGMMLLWAESGDDVKTALGITSRAVGHAAEILEPERYPAFTAERRGYVPANSSPTFGLWSRLATLRYLRAAAHALAWQEAGLDAPQIQVLTALWKEPAALSKGRIRSDLGMVDEQVEEVTGALQARGWVRSSEDMVEVTPKGRRAREAIEEATNRYNRPAYAQLTGEEHERLLSSLGRLPHEVWSG